MGRQAKTSSQTEPWERLPAGLRAVGEYRWKEYLQAAQELGERVPTDPEFCARALRVFASSEFVAELCRRNPHYLAELLASGDLLLDSWPGALRTRVAEPLAACADTAGLHRCLRRLRAREMLRIAWRDLAGWAPLEETLGDLSDLADACIQGALQRLAEWQAQIDAVPLRADRRPAQLVVIAMGKLGARELNFSSDVDLIFAYPDCQPGKRGALSGEEYFTRLGQALIQALSHQDQDGFVFRVDMRLRPYGSSGALVYSFEALEEYYQFQGREWERYAMIKARAVTGDAATRDELMQLLRPFVYRRYLDFHAFDALRELKRQIRSDVERRGQEENLKLGPGGIREIEFIAQAFQLVRGGREKRLRRRGVMGVLETLATLGLLPRPVVDELLAAYRFLRRAENRLQAMNDRQVHTLPDSPGEQAALALAMGYPGWTAFHAALNRHRRQVETHFQQVFALAPEGKAAAVDPLVDLWAQRLSDEQARRLLESRGFGDSVEALRWLQQLREGTVPRYLGEQGRLRFDALVPMLLAAVGRQPAAAEVLGRLVKVLERIAGRTTYLALLQENPQALAQLVKLCAASPWIAEQIAQFPMLLDQLLDPRALYAPLQRSLLEADLEQRLAGVAAEDLEGQMDRLRQFRHAMVLRVAAADVAGVAEVTLVSDQLSALAEVILNQVLSIAWNDMVARYGRPQCRVGRKKRPVAFTIVGYGKLGGRELGYGSDLDLVFLHDSEGADEVTSGKKTVDNSVFFARLGQRIIHLLETFTAAGILYEVDMRLRPSGNAGMLVSSFEAFEDYQRHSAWVWEHQALVRARPVAGDVALGAKFTALRAEVLAADARLENLRDQVREMRERMRRELGSRGEAGFHLKQDRGGIVDIEFMVQFLTLRWCGEHPQLLRHTATIHLLKALAKQGLLKSAYAQTLIEAYRQYRALGHRLTLAEASTVIDEQQLRGERRRVSAIWQQLMEV